MEAILDAYRDTLGYYHDSLNCSLLALCGVYGKVVEGAEANGGRLPVQSVREVLAAVERHELPCPVGHEEQQAYTFLRKRRPYLIALLKLAIEKNEPLMVSG